jgi:O-antigen ligase
MLGVFSIHRSRLLFSMGILLAVAYAYKELKRTAVVLAAVVLIGISSALALNAGWLPPSVARTFSTIVPSRVSDPAELSRTHGISGEMGWKSPFRVELMKIAWPNIRQHPLVGKGFILNMDDFTYDRGVGGAVKRLATSGLYHNAIVELAVFCGLPAAIAFTFAYCIGVWRFAGILRDISDYRLHLLCASVFGFFAATSGQMLMNGGARDFTAICILLAVMRGIVVRLEHAAGKEQT